MTDHDPSDLATLEDMLKSAALIHDPGVAARSVAYVQSAALLDIAVSLRMLAQHVTPDEEAGTPDDDAPATEPPASLEVGDVVVLNDPDDPDDDDADELIVTAATVREGVPVVDVIWSNGKEDRNVLASQFKFLRSSTNAEEERYRKAATKKKGKGNGAA